MSFRIKKTLEPKVVFSYVHTVYAKQILTKASHKCDNFYDDIMNVKV